MKYTARKARLLSLLCAAAVCLTLTPAASAAAEPALRSSGSTALEKLSKAEIVRLLADNPTDMPDQVFTQAPSINAPYATGAVSRQALQGAVNRLNALRRIAGLPDVALDAALCENAQYGAVISAHSGTLNHTPGQPGDMEESFYRQAYEATSTSNLSAGRTLCNAPDGLMDDNSASNVTALGHRRWQLNPALGKVGFGYAENPESIYRTFVVEKVFDTSAAPVDYDFIGWPASGNFPANYMAFHKDTAWSVTLNPQRYSTPVKGEITVTLTRLSDGQNWVFRGSESYTPAASGKYFNVDTVGYGVSNCIIFRPDGIDAYQGIYQVTIDGLKTKSGQPVDFTYQVDFFDPATYDASADEPSSWARESVEQALEANLVPASLQGWYPRTATRAEFCALAVQLYETATGSPVEGRVSFNDTSDANVEKAAYLGVVTGVGNGAFQPDDPLNREQAAVMLARLADAVGQPLPAGQSSFGDAASISSWARDAVGQMQGSGIMNGVGGNLFAPAQSYSREQSITTMLNLYRFLEG